MTLNQTVSVIRDLARMNLRLLRVNAVRFELLELENELNAERTSAAKLTEKSTKQSAVAQFNLDNLQPNDPEKADKTERWTEVLMSESEKRGTYAKHLADREKELNEAISAVNKRIEAVESGDWKCSKDDLQTEAVRLLNGLGKEKVMEAVKKAAELADF